MKTYFALVKNPDSNKLKILFPDACDEDPVRERILGEGIGEFHFFLNKTDEVWGYRRGRDNAIIIKHEIGDFVPLDNVRGYVLGIFDPDNANHLENMARFCHHLGELTEERKRAKQATIMPRMNNTVPAEGP